MVTLGGHNFYKLESILSENAFICISDHTLHCCEKILEDLHEFYLSKPFRFFFRGILNDDINLSLLRNYLPLEEAWSFINTNLNPLYPRINFVPIFFLSGLEALHTQMKL